MGQKDVLGKIEDLDEAMDMRGRGIFSDNDLFKLIVNAINRLTERLDKIERGITSHEQRPQIPQNETPKRRGRPRKYQA